MDAKIISKEEEVKDFAQVLAETPVQLEMNALELLLLTTTLGHSSNANRRDGLERVIRSSSEGYMPTHPISMLSESQKASVMNNYKALQWEDVRNVTNNILKQIGLGE